MATTRAGKSAEMIADDPKDVAKNGYSALMKGEHRVYGTMKVQLMHSAINLLPNETLASVTRVGLEKDH